ncbi:filamentous hemagglutinin N-terminal domain-containing protein [uncultured Nostoc sp.]|uniref:two-partner secretion domain-containing protein n=1 Tax=uncultured Nostoc sp. TaxID=340711 RepID=UPI0026263D91|nr:filamentous hemagglutinin N-terminal domain-containing protein [uncultured Nostoc sp.]
MSNVGDWYRWLRVVIISIITFHANSAIAQIIEDNTLPTNSQVTAEGNNIRIIEGGTPVGSNLFHSFKEFSVSDGTTAEFRNPVGIQNIISRVTGKSISNIEGIIKAKNTANLFLINPNGIIFGPNASLQIGGSFIASTASSLNFADGTKFSAIDPQTIPLLTVSVPFGLQFGASAAPIYNKSQVPSLDGATNSLGFPVGLQVQTGKTLALVGGDITLEGGNLTARSGRIELGSVAGNSLVKVSLNPINQAWSLGYDGVQNFQNIQLIQRTNTPSYVDVSGEGGGNIQVQGRRLLLDGGSIILANTLGLQPRANLTVTASDSVELIGSGTSLRTRNLGIGNAGDLTITTTKLIVRDGAQIVINSNRMSSGSAGLLTVNASDSVELIGGASIQSPLPNNNNFLASGLFSATAGNGNAGDITITTRRLHIEGGARVLTDSAGSMSASGEFIPAKGQGGHLTVNASESVELVGIPGNSSRLSGLFASTQGFGSAGDLTLTTGQLIVRDGAVVTVSSEFQNDLTYEIGAAGNLNVTARSILLDNKGQITSNSESGRGGDIKLHVWDLLGLGMRHNSQITTNAGGNGNGGNITIKVPNGFIFAVPSENSDISANAVGGNGGNVKIDALGVIGTQYREKPTNYSDITASSEFGLNGKVQINSPDADPSRGLVELPVNLVDASKQIVADCNSGTKIARSSFIRTGRGGLIADPTQPLIADDAVLADWITLSPESQNHADSIPKRAVVQAQRNTDKKSQKVNSVNDPTQIVEAQGWVINANGNVVLVAQVPTATPHNSWLNTASCAAK